VASSCCGGRCRRRAWLGALRHHHDAPNGPLLGVSHSAGPADQRADRYAARLSARNRAAVGQAAAQAAFFDEGGHPDEAGQALLAKPACAARRLVKLAAARPLVMKRQPNPRAPLTVVSLVNVTAAARRAGGAPHRAAEIQVEAGVPGRGARAAQPSAAEAGVKPPASGLPQGARAADRRSRIAHATECGGLGAPS
jgi:hypothetical protein